MCQLTCHILNVIYIFFVVFHKKTSMREKAVVWFPFQVTWPGKMTNISDQSSEMDAMSSQ